MDKNLKERNGLCIKKISLTAKKYIIFGINIGHFNWNGAEGTRISNGNCNTSGDQKCWKKPGNFELRFKIYNGKHEVVRILIETGNLLDEVDK